ncbi:MAG: MarR family transcriptional regulator [Actinophytocola sp.]|nr:MarR family transcriptional regulator [Actinophytocola sp.]
MTCQLFPYTGCVTDTRWLSESEQRAWRAYLSVQAQLNARLARQMQAESELSLSDFEVLVHLTDTPNARVRAFELARLLQWEKSRLSHHLARMQRRGLVDREECPEDARGAFIVITPAGRAAIERAAPAHVEAVRQLVFDVLTGEQVEALREICEQVLTRLADEDPRAEVSGT